MKVFRNLHVLCQLPILVKWFNFFDIVAARESNTGDGHVQLQVVADYYIGFFDFQGRAACNILVKCLKWMCVPIRSIGRDCKQNR